MKNVLLPGGRKFAPPRHEVVPAFASHSADDVVELLSAVDLQLDGHQHHILTGATGVLRTASGPRLRSGCPSRARTANR